jgi:23S rRNA pseudouridine2605 synthase
MPSKRERKPSIEAKAASPEGERIAKVMARAGMCSRREAEAWITAGRVSVNGTKITSPALNVRPQDRIAIDGEPLPARERTRLFLYNKPRGLVTTNADPEGRPTIFAALPKGLPRLVTVGRLDMNTEGLLLLTNDGGLARVLELPETGWLRRYRVRAHGNIMQPQLDALRKGVTIDGIRYGEIEATLDRAQGANVWLTFAIREGKNREVRNVLEHLGLKVNRLIRVSYGPFQLGDLKDGAVEEIRTRHLREQLGARIADAAGADFSGPISIAPSERDLGGHERDEKPRYPEVRAKRASKDDGERQSRTSLPRPEAKRRKKDTNRRGPEGVEQKGFEKRRHPEARAKRASKDDAQRETRAPLPVRSKARRWGGGKGKADAWQGSPSDRPTRFVRGKKSEDRRNETNRPGKPFRRPDQAEQASRDERPASPRKVRRHGPFRAPSGGKRKR